MHFEADVLDDIYSPSDGSRFTAPLPDVIGFRARNPRRNPPEMVGFRARNPRRDPSETVGFLSRNPSRDQPAWSGLPIKSERIRENPSKIRATSNPILAEIRSDFFVCDFYKWISAGDVTIAVHAIADLVWYIHVYCVSWPPRGIPVNFLYDIVMPSSLYLFWKFRVPSTCESPAT